MIIRIRTVYDDGLWIDSEDLARARGRGPKLILIRDRSGVRRYRNGDSLPGPDPGAICSSTSTISPAVTANERLSHLHSGRDRALRRSLPRPPGQRFCAARG